MEAAHARAALPWTPEPHDLLRYRNWHVGDDRDSRSCYPAYGSHRPSSHPSQPRLHATWLYLWPFAVHHSYRFYRCVVPAQ